MRQRSNGDFGSAPADGDERAFPASHRALPARDQIWRQRPLWVMHEPLEYPADHAIDGDFWQADGASAVSMPGVAGRFAAEWCPSGTTSQSSVLRPRGQRRGKNLASNGGGVMAGRAILDRGQRPAAEVMSDGPVLTDTVAGGNPSSEAGQAGTTPARPAALPWRGAGGRWLIWPLRAVVWAILLLIGYRGVAAIFAGQPVTPAAVSSTRSASQDGFPVSLAEAYAVEFGRVYLNFSPAKAAWRAVQLAAFLPAGADSSAGWNGIGTERALDVQVAGLSVRGPHSAVITLLARVNGRLIRLGVPIYAAHGALAVSAYPAVEPGPGKASPPAANTAAQDVVTASALKVQLRAFFQAYASGDAATMNRFLAPRATVHGLGGAVSFGSIVSVRVPAGGSTRTIIVTVAWQLPAQQASGSVSAAPAMLDMTYQLRVIRQSGSWYVDSIAPSTQLPGPP
jgi:Conjugative transposon protein TcpC